MAQGTLLNTLQWCVYMGKQPKKRLDVCVCATDSLCCTNETNTAL